MHIVSGSLETGVTLAHNGHIYKNTWRPNVLKFLLLCRLSKAVVLQNSLHISEQ